MLSILPRAFVYLNSKPRTNFLSREQIERPTMAVQSIEIVIRFVNYEHLGLLVPVHAEHLAFITQEDLAESFRG